ncbi:MAG: hypothetical protein H7328_10595 [Bdellovibrio sp.]|nr:hypothetical protein [Bdellovibrio sp.]
MKNLFVSVAVLCFSAMTMAQVVITPDLNIEGSFGKRQTGIIKAAKDAKACKKARGYTFKDKCYITRSQDTVSIEKLDSSSYLVKISQKVAHKKNVDTEVVSIVAQNQNLVQLISHKDSCDIIVGFTNPTRLSVWTEGICANQNDSININDLKRAVVAKAKKK